MRKVLGWRVELVLAIVLSLTEGRTGFLSIGLLGTTWAASSGLLNLMGALNVVYDVKETLPSIPSEND